MKKNTIAFLTRSLTDATGSNMWRGIVTKCKADNTPVITFRGPILNQGTGSIIYHLFDDNTFAGIVSWASSDATPEAIQYYNRFQNTPLLCMTFQIPGHPVILTDCKSGEKELMNHLIDFHNFTRIAFIRGPAAHVYAKDRYEGYLESLKEHNIPVNEQLISQPSGWTVGDGAKAIDEFIRLGLKPGTDFQAVVAVGDNVAIGAQEELQKRGFSVPQVVAVCGFNGSNDAACCNPPITTVEMPFRGQGSKAFDTIKELIQGRSVPQEYKYSSKLIISESCGCTSHSLKKAVYVNTENPETKKSLFRKNKNTEECTQQCIKLITSKKWQDELNARVTSGIESNRYGTQEIVSYISAKLSTLTHAFVDDLLAASGSKPVFLKTLSHIITGYLSLTDNVVLWQDVISEYRNEFLAVCLNTGLTINVENLCQQSRILINEIDERTQKLSTLLESRYEAQLRLTSTSLLSSYDIPELMNIISKSLSKLDIPGVYVVLYNNDGYIDEANKIPNTSKLILAVRDGNRLELGHGGVDFPTRQIIPDEYLPVSNFYSLIVESLHFQDSLIGYIVFQQGSSSAVAYSVLRDQLSSSLYGALILQQLNQNKAVLEQTMETMSTKAEIVSEQSNKISGNISTISQSMDSVAKSIKNISGNIQTVSDTVTSTDTMISEAKLSITNLVESTHKISNAVFMINDIAEKTNVLSLNASIEAAHAGDAGKGFSVVAKEVKTLAAQIVNSTQSIQELVSQNNENAKITEELITSTNTSIKTITELSQNIRDSINAQVESSSEISQQLGEATTGSNQIASAISEIAALGDELVKSKGV